MSLRKARRRVDRWMRYYDKLARVNPGQLVSRRAERDFNRCWRSLADARVGVKVLVRPLVPHVWNGSQWMCLSCGQVWPDPCGCPCVHSWQR